MSQPVIEFFWDAVSPYTYFASTQIEAIAERSGASVQWKPFLIGAAFKATGNAPPAIAVPAKGKYMMTDLKLSAAYLNIPVTMPANFPINSLLPMRFALAAMQTDKGTELAKAMMRAHWGEGKDISQAEVLGELAANMGLDGEALLAATQDQAVKDELKANCESAISRGAFGAPTFFVGNTMFWGHDRLPVLEAFLQGKIAA
ncbi:MAG: 2-hydroxychromene-2-carboxylate isomerase [Nevskiales bacterium]